MKNLQIIISGIILIAGLFLGGQVYSQNVYFNGIVKGVPNYNNLNGAKVVAIKTETEARVDSTYTNANGNYNMQFIWDGVSNHEKLEDKVYPNPYTNQTKINTFTTEDGIYRLLVTGIDGKTFLNTSVNLESGNNTLNLNGGQAGIHLITLANNKTSKTYKAVQTESTGAPITYNLVHTDFSGPILKSGLEDIILVGDEVRLEFTKDGYILGDTTFIVQPNNVANKQLQQVPYVFSTILKPFLDDGTPITTLSPGWNTTIEFPSAPQGPGTKTYTPDGNNEIVIQENFYPLNGELGNAIMHHDTSNYTVGGVSNGVLSWIVLGDENQQTNQANLAQTSSTNLIPEVNTTVSLDSLNGKIVHYYTLRKKAEGQPGVWYSMDAQPVTGFMLSSGELTTSGFVKIPPAAADSLIFAVRTTNETTGQPTPSAQLDRTENEENKILALYTLQNGRELLPPHSMDRTQPGDATWNKIQGRGYVNTVILTFYNGTPANTRAWKNDYTYNGELRLDFSVARYNTTSTDGQIYTENYSATSGIEEGTGDLGIYVYNGSTGNPTQLAGTMARWVKIVDLGSGQSKKSSSASSGKTKEVYSVSVSGQAPVFSTDPCLFCNTIPSSVVILTELQNTNR